MKKIFSIVLSAILIFSCLSTCACKQAETESVITYDKKYIQTLDFDKDESQQNYYVFYKDGSCIHHHYERPYGDYISTYLCTFKYSLVKDQGTLFYFYHSVEFLDAHNYPNEYVGPNTSGYLMVSQDVIMDENGSFYVCEDFIDNIPNFGK